jgi:hypothetical protein
MILDRLAASLKGRLRFDQGVRAQFDDSLDSRLLYIRPPRGRRIAVVRNFLAEAKAKMAEASR